MWCATFDVSAIQQGRCREMLTSAANNLLCLFLSPNLNCILLEFSVWGLAQGFLIIMSNKCIFISGDQCSWTQRSRDTHGGTNKGWINKRSSRLKLERACICLKKTQICMMWTGEHIWGLRVDAQHIWQTSNTFKMKLFNPNPPSSVLYTVAQKPQSF